MIKVHVITLKKLTHVLCSIKNKLNNKTIKKLKILKTLKNIYSFKKIEDYLGVAES